jgi:hypothetical protein
MIRKLKTSDLFSLSRILKKMNIKDDIKGLAKNVTGLSKEQKKKAEQEMEIDLAMLFFENITNAEQEIYKFFGDISGKKPEEIADQPPKDTLNMIKELINQEGIGSFLSAASK